MESTITLKNIEHRYRRNSPIALAIGEFTLPIGRTLVLGPNGAGKSTFLGIIAGTIAPRVGQRLAATKSHDSIRVSFMPQHIRAVPRLRIEEQVAYAGWLAGLNSRAAAEASSPVLERVGLKDKIGQRTTALSGGQLRRVGLAEALIVKPDVLLLDEPTAGLDPAQRSRFRQVLLDLPSTHSTMIASHLVDDLEELYDHVIVICEGRIVFVGNPSLMLAQGEGTDERSRAESAYAKIVGRVFA